MCLFSWSESKNCIILNFNIEWLPIQKMIPSLAEQGRGQGQASVWNMHPAPRASPARTHSSPSITECRHFTNVDLSWWALCRICRCKLQVALGMEEIDLLLLQLLQCAVTKGARSFAPLEKLSAHDINNEGGFVDDFSHDDPVMSVLLVKRSRP